MIDLTLSSNHGTTVSIVTYNSADYIETCVQSLLEQTTPPQEIVITDNASADRSVDIIRKAFGSEVQLRCHRQNLGFSLPHNRVIRQSHSSYVLVLNPDTKLQNDFIEKLTMCMESHPGLGSATGKLLRMDHEAKPLKREGMRLIDSTGMYFLPNQRHADRGAGEKDHGQFAERQLVFGTTAAAGFYRKTMLEDIALQEEYYDEGFFVYREDVDLAWRSILYGWSCGYVPEAEAYHVRFGIPERRHLLSPEINYHSVKNRFLLRIKNMPLSSYVRHLPAIGSRDLLVIGYALLKERRSLPAFSFILKNRHKYSDLRQIIIKRSRISSTDIEKWIGWKPKAYPFLPPPSPLL
jgi:GT2 family glycosyltransferase